MLFQKLVLHAHVHMPADKCCLYAGTVQLKEVDFNSMEALKVMTFRDTWRI